MDDSSENGLRKRAALWGIKERLHSMPLTYRFHTGAVFLAVSSIPIKGAIGYGHWLSLAVTYIALLLLGAGFIACILPAARRIWEHQYGSIR